MAKKMYIFCQGNIYGFRSLPSAFISYSIIHYSKDLFASVDILLDSMQKQIINDNINKFD